MDIIRYPFTQCLSHLEISDSRMPWGLAELFPFLLLSIHFADCFDWESLDLPDDHLPFYFNNNPDIKQQCEEDSACPFKVSITMIYKLFPLAHCFVLESLDLPDDYLPFYFNNNPDLKRCSVRKTVLVHLR